jgi:hypothetical protein
MYFADIRLGMTPGKPHLTRMLNRPTSRESALVKAITPPFDAE